MERRAYSSAVSDEAWMLVALALTLMTEDGPPREHALHARFKGLRDSVRAGAPWRRMPNDGPHRKYAF